MNHRLRTRLCMCTAGGLLLAAAAAIGLSMTALMAAAGGDPGACCFADGSCTVERLSVCSAQGGIYQGDGTNC